MICAFGGLIFIFIGIIFCLYPSKKERTFAYDSSNTDDKLSFKKENFYGKFLIILGVSLLLLGTLLFYFIDSSIFMYVEFVVFISSVILSILFWDKYIKLLIKNLNNKNKF